MLLLEPVAEHSEEPTEEPQAARVPQVPLAVVVVAAAAILVAEVVKVDQ